MSTILRLMHALRMLLVSSFAVSTSLAAEPAVKIMPLGDSLTSGLSDTSVQGAYRNRLHTVLTNAGFNVDFIGTFTDANNPALPDSDHQGQGSARIDQIHANLPQWLNAVDDPDVVLLLIGTNDFWQNYNLSGIQSRLEALIGEIAESRPYAKIILSNLPLRIDSPALESLQNAFNDTLPALVAGQVALGRQVSLVDMHSAWTAADINGDGVHPTATGFNKMADVWLPGIADVISPGGTDNPPVIVNVEPTADLDGLTVRFSKPLADTAANVANFNISDGLTVTSASLDSETKRTITLTTVAQTPGVVYTLAVSGVRDRTVRQTSVAPGSMARFSSNTIVNGSFESDFDGWVTSGNVQIKSALPYLPTDGSKVAAFNTDNLDPGGSIAHSFPTSPGTTYELTFDFGILSFNTSQQRVRTDIEGASTLVSDLVTMRGLGGGTNRWAPLAYTFVADSPSTTIRFTDASTTTGSLDMMIDNIRLGSKTSGALAVTSTPAAGANMTITPADEGGSANGPTGLVRSYANGTSVTVTTPASHNGAAFLHWQKNGIKQPDTGTSITLVVSDSVSLNAVYESANPPVAVADAYSTPIGTTLAVPLRGVLANDFDGDNDYLTAAADTGPAHGTLLLNRDGSFTYTPDAGYQGPDSFTYHANDGLTNSNVVQVSITVFASASQLLVNGSFENDFAGWTPTGNLAIYSSSPYAPTDGTKLTAFNSGQTNPNGTLTQSFGTVPGQTYQLAFDVGALSFNTYYQRLAVSVDGTSNRLSQTITIRGPGKGNTRWLPQEFSFVADSATTTLSFRDTSTTSNNVDLVLDRVSVSGNSSSHTLTVESSPATGIAIALSPADLAGDTGGITNFTRGFSAGTIVNLSAPPSAGSSFVKWLKDGADFSSSPNISVEINADTTLTALYGDNDPPVAANDSYATQINIPLVVPAPGLLANDTDADSPALTVSVDQDTLNGTLSLNSDGSFSYTPNTGYLGPDSFTYHANDGAQNSNTATVSINVVPDSPGSVFNGSFEDGESGWTGSGNRLVAESTPPYIPTDGNNLMIFNAGQTAPDAVISQAFDTSPGRAYLLELDMGVLGSPGIQQRLLVSIDGNAPLVSSLHSLTTGGFASAIWQPLGFLFVADSSSTTVTLADSSPTGTNADLLVDNVRLSPASAFPLTVRSSAGPGLAVTLSPTDLNGLDDGTTPFSRFYSGGTDVSLTAPATLNGEDFVKWTRDGVDFSTDAAIGITLDSAATLTAVYTGNKLPVAAADTYQTDAGQALVVTAPQGLLQNDSDADSDPLTAVLDTDVSNGTLILSTDGGFTYTPADGFSGPDSFTYHANDGSGDSEITSVSITVNQPLSSSLANGSFETGDFIVDPATMLENWTVTGNPFGYIAGAGYTSTDGLRIAVFNGGLDSYGGTISQTIATTPGTTYEIGFDAAIFGANNKKQRLLVTVEGASTVLSETVDLTATGTSATSQWLTRSHTFVADSDSSTITFTDASAALGSQATGSDLLLDRVSFVTAVPNTSPVADDDSYQTDFAVELIVAAPGLLANDTDGESDALTATLDIGPANGTLTLDTDGGFTYTPDPSFTGSDSFTYLANDGEADSAPATVTITVNPPTGGNILANASFETGDDSTAPVTALDNWTSTGNPFGYIANTNYTATDGLRMAVFNGGGDTYGGTISQVVATTPGATYELKFDTGIFGAAGKKQRLLATVDGTAQVLAETINLTATTGPAQWKTNTFTFIADSSSSTLTFTDNSATLGSAASGTDMLLDQVALVIEIPNEPPVANADRHTTPVDTSLTVPAPGLLDNDTDAENDPLTAVLDSDVSHGTLNLASDGGFSYLPDPGYEGPDSFTYHANDGSADSNVVTVNLDVITVDPAVIANGGFESDEDGWTITGNRLLVTASAPYLPTEGNKLIVFNAGQTAPNATLTQTLTTIPGQAYRIDYDLGAVGKPGAKQRMRITVNGDSPLLTSENTVTASGFSAAVWISPVHWFVANSDSTTITLTDNSPTSNSVDLLLDNVRISTDSATALTILTTAGTGLDVTVSPADLNGRADGTAGFTRYFAPGTTVDLEAPATFAGEAFLKWEIDGTDSSVSPATSITLAENTVLTAVYTGNTAPVANPDSYLTAYETPLAVPAAGILGNDTDIDSDPLTAVVDTLPANGTLTLNPDGGFTYQPDPGFSGTDSFEYHAEDAKAASPTATVTITVSPEGAGSLANGSFEDDDNGWTTSGNYFVIETQGAYVPTDGNKLLVSNGGNLPPNAVLSQQITTIPGNTYVLALDLGVVGGIGTQQRLKIDVTGTANLISQTKTVAGVGVAKAAWNALGYTFVADSATTTLALTDISASGSGVDLLIDNVRLTPLIPQTLTVESTPAAALAISASKDLNGDGNGTTGFTRSYNKGSTATLTAPANAGASTFLKWTLDGADHGTETSVTVTMNADHTLTAVYYLNEAPVAGDDSFAVQAGSQLIVAAPGVLGNDSDPNTDTLEAVLDSSPADGSLALNPGGGFTYTPDPSFIGTDSFTYHTTDGSLDSNPATVTLNVQAVAAGSLGNGSFEDDDNSWATSGNYLIIETVAPYLPTDGNRLVAFNNAQKTPNGVFSQTVATTPGQAYTISFDTGAVGKSGSKQRIQLTVQGTTTLVSEPTTITATGGTTAVWVSKSYSYVADSTSTVITFADISPTSFNVDLLLDNVRNVSDIPIPRTVTIASSPADAVEITVTPDDLGGNSNGTTGFNRSFNQGANITLSAPATAGGLDFSKWTKNGADLALTETTTVLVDGDITLTAVYAANQPPSAADDRYTTAVDTPLAIPAPGVLANDTDLETDALTATVDTLPASGTLALDDNGGFTYTPAPGYEGPDSFTYHANDGNSNSNPATVDITITQVAVATLVNGSFESGFTGWQASGNVKTDSSPPPTNGIALAVFNSANSTPNGTLSQAFATTPGATYTLSFDYGVFSYNTSLQRIQVALTGNSTLLNQTASIRGTGSGNINWSSASYSFTADSPLTTLVFTDTSPATNALDLLFDNVRLATDTEAPAQHTLTVNSDPASPVGITVSPADLDGSSDGTTPFNRRFSDGTSVTLTAPATSGATSFVKWRKNGADFGTNPTVNVTIDGDHGLTAVYAAPSAGNLLVNGSFESGFTGWTATGSTDSVKVNSIIPFTDGTSGVEFNSAQSVPDGRLSQSFATTPGASYQLAFDIGTFSYNTNPQRLKVQLTGSGALLTETTTINGLGSGIFDWKPRSYTFVADNATTTLTLTDVSATTSAIDLLLDNVRVTLIPDIPAQRALTVTSTGISGVNIATTPADSNGNTNGTTGFGRIFPDGTSVTLTAPATSGPATFVNWKLDGNNLGTDLAVTFTMDANHTLVAVYDNPEPEPVQFVNGSFESGLNGWIPGGSTGSVRAGPNANATDGTSLVEFNATNSPNDGTLTQTFVTSPGTAYAVKFDLGVFAFNTNWQKLGVTLTGDSSLIAAQDFSLRGLGGGAVKWSTNTLNFTAVSSTTTLTFRDKSTTSNSIDMLLDRVTLNTQAAPGDGPNLLVNGGFDGTPDYVGWSHAGSTRIEKPGPDLNYTTSGRNILSFNVGEQPTDGEASQSFPTVPGLTYKIRYDVGVLGTRAVNQSLLMTLTGNGQLLSKTTNVLGRTDFTMIWVPQEFTFVANSAATTLKFADKSATTNSLDLFLDTVEVRTTVAAAPLAAPAFAEAIVAPTSQSALLAGTPPESLPIASESSLGATAPLVLGTPTLLVSPEACTICLHATEAGTYILERSTDLSTWKPYGEPVTVEHAGPVQFIDSDTAGPCMYYRIARQTRD